ncbi:MAG: PulJ/GspJ family protein [Gemmatimonadaceae bacterium]
MKRSGLTLLELVVALTVTGLVLSAGFAALGSLRDRRESLRAATTELSRAAALRTTLREWLSGAELTIEEDAVDFRGLDGVSADLADDELRFRTSTSSPLAPAGTTIRLYIDRSDSTPERGLVAELQESTRDPRRVLELDANVTALDVRYLSLLGAQEKWSASWISFTVLPAAVELRLLPAASGRLDPLLELPLLVPLGGGVL